MDTRAGTRWMVYLVASVVTLVAMGFVWAIAPDDVRGWLLLVGAAAYGLVIVVGYALERRLHW